MTRGAASWLRMGTRPAHSSRHAHRALALHQPCRFVSRAGFGESDASDLPWRLLALALPLAYALRATRYAGESFVSRRKKAPITTVRSATTTGYQRPL